MKTQNVGAYYYSYWNARNKRKPNRQSYYFCQSGLSTIFLISVKLLIRASNLLYIVCHIGIVICCITSLCYKACKVTLLCTCKR